jgi:hypothetical protein
LLFTFVSIKAERRAEGAEDAHAALRREAKRREERNGSQQEAKARGLAEARRGLASANELLKRSNADLSGQLTEVRATHSLTSASLLAAFRLTRSLLNSFSAPAPPLYFYFYLLRTTYYRRSYR